MKFYGDEIDATVHAVSTCLSQVFCAYYLLHAPPSPDDTVYYRAVELLLLSLYFQCCLSMREIRCKYMYVSCCKP